MQQSFLDRALERFWSNLDENQQSWALVGFWAFCLYLFACMDPGPPPIDWLKDLKLQHQSPLWPGLTIAVVWSVLIARKISRELGAIYVSASVCWVGFRVLYPDPWAWIAFAGMVMNWMIHWRRFIPRWRRHEVKTRDGHVPSNMRGRGRPRIYAQRPRSRHVQVVLD